MQDQCSTASVPCRVLCSYCSAGTSSREFACRTCTDVQSVQVNSLELHNLQLSLYHGDPAGRLMQPVMRLALQYQLLQ